MSTLGEAKARERQQTAGRLLIRSLVQRNVTRPRSLRFLVAESMGIMASVTPS
jgi:hypothetical protein